MTALTGRALAEDARKKLEERLQREGRRPNGEQLSSTANFDYKKIPEISEEEWKILAEE